MTIDSPYQTMTVTTLAKPSKEYREETLFDMEAAGFFMAASKFLSPECIHCVKIISDSGSFPHFLIREKQITDMIFAQCPSLESLLGHLKRAALESHPPPSSDRYLEQWHFTHSEKEKLSDILYRIEALQPQEADPDFSHCKSAQEVLSLLEEKAKKLPIFCGIKKPVS
jgi:hypothetical protein